jgi:hypothetical protein
MGKPKYTIEYLRDRILKSGWNLRELPIRTGGSDSAEIRAWKMIAVKGDRSVQLEGKTLEIAIESICKTLGLIG